MTRNLDTATLDGAAKHYAGLFLRDTEPFPREWVMGQFFNFTFKDEFDYLTGAIRGQLGAVALADFDARAKKAFKPRSEATFAGLLADKLAIAPDGAHIPGKIGTANLGARVVGKRIDRNGAIRNAYWPIYAGEGEERAADSGVADALPEGTEPLPLGALNTRIANVIAIKACDIIVDELDTGTADGMIEGRSGAQPADPDTAVTGTLLFALDLATPAFGAAVDDAPGAIATAGAIADDTSADNTGTLGYCRASSSNSFPTPLDDLIDGEAGTSGADFNFNTLSIVSGSTVSMTSWTVTMPES